MSLLNKSHVRQFALDSAKTLRPAHPFNRVSQEFLDRVEGNLRQFIANEIRRLPSVGKTIK
jgi:hypothetical protein